MEKETPNQLNTEMEQRDSFEVATRKIYENALKSGLINRIIEGSGHATQIEDGKDLSYDRVDFVGYFGVRGMAGGIVAQPVFRLKSGAEGSSQPVTPKMYRLERNTEKQQELADSLYEGINDQDKSAIIRMVLKKLEGSSLLYTSEAPTFRRAIKEVNRGIERGTLKITIDPEYAALQIKP